MPSIKILKNGQVLSEANLKGLLFFQLTVLGDQYDEVLSHITANGSNTTDLISYQIYSWLCNNPLEHGDELELLVEEASDSQWPTPETYRQDCSQPSHKQQVAAILRDRIAQRQGMAPRYPDLSWEVAFDDEDFRAFYPEPQRCALGLGMVWMGGKVNAALFNCSLEELAEHAQPSTYRTALCGVGTRIRIRIGQGSQIERLRRAPGLKPPPQDAWNDPSRMAPKWVGRIPGLSVVEAKVEEAQEILDLLRRSSARMADWFDHPENGYLCRHRIEHAWEGTSTHFVVFYKAVLDGHLVGAVRCSRDGPAKRQSLSLLAVDPETRGRKIGACLVGSFEYWFQGEGVFTTVLDTDDQASIGFFKHLGYRVIHEEVLSGGRHWTHMEKPSLHVIDIDENDAQVRRNAH